MRLLIYDANPGDGGVWQRFLRTSWWLGGWFFRLTGSIDAMHAATSWPDALAWLGAQPKPVEQIQYWGHGSPGAAWLARVPLTAASFALDSPLRDLVKALRGKLAPSAVIWFRTCSTFQGREGHSFSRACADALGCVAAGHTRIIGPLQGGLHTRRPDTYACWPPTEGELPPSWLPAWLRWGHRTVTCLRSSIPRGW